MICHTNGQASSAANCSAFASSGEASHHSVCLQEIQKFTERAETQSRAALSRGWIVIGPAEGSAPVKHPPLGPGAAATAMQLSTFEGEEAEVRTAYHDMVGMAWDVA